MSVIKWLDNNIESVLITAITAVMTVCLFAQVLFRFFIGWPLDWTDEVAINLLVWLCYFGSSLAVKQRRHLRIDIIPYFLSPRMRSVFDLIANFCFFCFTSFVLWQLGRVTLQTYQWGQITAVLEVPRWIIYFVAWTAWALTLLRLIQDTIRSLGEYKAGGIATAESVQVEDALASVAAAAGDAGEKKE
jgi:TRAP-type C4-dicarboxylate transport system permease small subunit